MTMISQSSYLSTSSRQQTVVDSFNLQKIQADVFNRIVQLKNKKIQLLQYLSQCMDKKYQIQAEYIHQLQIKKKKEQNLASRTQYEPAIRRNVELRAEIQELERQIAEKQAKDLPKNYGQKSRTKSVYDLSKSKSKQLNKRQTQKSRHQLQGSRSQHQSNFRQSSSYNIFDQDELIDQIIEQRRLNNQLNQALLQQNNRIFKSKSISNSHSHSGSNSRQLYKQIQKLTSSQNIALISQKQSQIQQLIRQKQQKIQQQKLTKSIRPITNSRPDKSTHQSRQSRTNQKNQTQTNTQIQIKQLLRYIDEEQSQKRLLYQELMQFKNQMQLIRQQNDKMKNELGLQNDRQ